MLGFMADCLLRATVLVAGVQSSLVGIRSPRVKHAVWTSATLTMLALPFLRAVNAGPTLRIPVPVLPGSPLPLLALPSLPGGAGMRTVLIAAYALGALFLLGRLLWGTWQARRMLRNSFRDSSLSGSSEDHGLLLSPACASPVTIGWWQPRIVLPQSSRSWPAEQVRAVLAHEREHARWRDPLAQWCVLLNRSLFWVHPAAWWMERQMGELAEDACDRAVLSQGYSAVAYAGFLLDCAAALQNPRTQRIEFGMGIGGRGLARRIPGILSGLGRPAEPRWRKLLAGLLCTAVAVGSAALSVQLVGVRAPSSAAVHAAVDPLPVTILTPVPTSLTAVAAPMEQGGVPSLPPQDRHAGGLTEVYLDLAGMSASDRIEAGSAVRRWLAGLPADRVDRQIAIVVNAGNRNRTVQRFTSDHGRIAETIDSLLANRAPLPAATVQARMDAVELVVHELLAFRGERDLVCLLGTDAAVPADPGMPLQPRSVRFVPSSFPTNP